MGVISIFQRKYNQYHEEKDYMVCECSDGKYFIFDKEDYEKIKPYYWNFQNGRVRTHIKRKSIGLPQFILGLEQPNQKVFLLSDDKSDYRKSNFYYKNTYIEYDDYYEGICYDGKRFKIDKEDYPLVSQYIWHVDSNGYVITKINGETFKQHRMILKLGKDDPREVDHIHHDQLDNRKQKLRIVTRSQNCMNTRKGINNLSGIKGVYKMKSYNKWIAQIKENGKCHYLGCFNSLEEAAQARYEAEQKYHAEYACNE